MNARVLQVAKVAPFVKRKRQFFFRHDVHQDHFVAAVAKMMQGLYQRLKIAEQVADHDYQAAAMNPFGDIVEYRRQLGFAAGLQIVERIE